MAMRSRSPLTNRADERCAFEQIVARGGENAAFGYRSAPVAGAADTLQANGNRTRRTDLANQIDTADIDSEFERSGGHQRANFSGFQFSFGGEPQLARETAVMRGDGVLSQAFAEMMRHALGETARVDEDER